ncbi:MAG: AMP-binding protein [Cytophagales bacterium]|nr:AMP-binding protein [Cytophagales bacterium]
MNTKQFFEKLKGNATHHLEFYKEGAKHKKSFGQMYADIVRTYGYLRKLGLKRRDRVGIMGENSYEWILLDLACFYGGYVSVAFHNNKFESEIDTIVDKYQLRVLFVNKAPAGGDDNTFTFSQLEHYLKDFEGSDAGPAEENRDLIGRDEIFTIYFTSGTTAFPKAMGMTMKSCANFIETGNKLIEMNARDKVILFLPFSAVLERIYVYASLMVGFDMILVPTENVMKSLKQDKPTVLLGVPYLFENVYRVFWQNVKGSLWKTLVVHAYFLLKKAIPAKVDQKIQAAIFGKIINFWGGKMRLMITGAAPINKKVLKFYNDIGIVLLEAYGLTETGLIGLNTPAQHKLGSVGKPFPNKEVRIEENGQIVVKGDYFFSSGYGYLDADASDRDKFRKDGFFETGDVGFIDKDGFLHITGRLKEMIVLSNGKKVHPHTIEEKINQSHLIRQSVVFGDQKPFLTAVVVKETPGADEDTIRKEIKKLNEGLPDHLKIKDVVVSDQAFSRENRLLTDIMKLNRKEIHKTYERALNELY